MSKHIEALLIAILILLAPLRSIALSILFLTFCDLILGILAARKQDIPITSSGLKRTVAKILLYMCAVLVSYIA